MAILEDQAKEFKTHFEKVDQECNKFTNDISKLDEVKADREDLKEMLDKLNALLKEVEEAMKWKQPMVQVTNRIDKIEIQIQQLMNGLGKGEGLDGQVIQGLEDKIQALRDDFEKFKEDVMKWLKDLQDALDNKADITALKELEKYLLGQIDDLAAACDKKYADKNETKKALKALEKQIKNLFDLLMNQEGRQGDDDAMFAKKPLGGWSCASCAKDLVNLQGLQADFVPWSRWPLRDPNERLAKSGQGFSRILSKMKPEYVTQPHFYPHDSMTEDQYQTLPAEKLTVKKKKKKIRPMSANRVSVKQ